MDKEIKETVIQSALDLLAKHEKLNDSKQHVTLSEMSTHLHWYKKLDLTKKEINTILSEDFSSKFDGKETIFFLKV